VALGASFPIGLSPVASDESDGLSQDSENVDFRMKLVDPSKPPVREV
jgi:hypothetical protein